MADIIYIRPQELASKRKLAEGLIAPAKENVEFDLAGDHKAEPIKSLEDIHRITEYLVANERYRDNMLFICGINFGLRISDLLRLRFCNLIDEDMTFKEEFPILEKKTAHTRKTKKNRWLSINDAVVDAVTLYLQHVPSKLDDYMFRSESQNRGGQNVPMSRMAVHNILTELQETLGIDAHLSSHTLRKTFGYHQMAMSGNDPRKLVILQRMFGHSSLMQTMEYIGITDEEISEAYMNLNLGGKDYVKAGYESFSKLHEVL